jgi:ribosomal protein S18 acetylase RimI-like enzyme
MTEGLERPRGHSFTRIAELDGGAAGYCFVAAPGREEAEESRLAELVALYVDPERWRRGVGRTLLDAVLADAESLPYDEIFLWTFAVNEPALALYRAAGFDPDGAERPFVPTGTPTVRLRRSLAPRHH